MCPHLPPSPCCSCGWGPGRRRDGGQDAEALHTDWTLRGEALPRVCCPQPCPGPGGSSHLQGLFLLPSSLQPLPPWLLPNIRAPCQSSEALCLPAWHGHKHSASSRTSAPTDPCRRGGEASPGPSSSSSELDLLTSWRNQQGGSSFPDFLGAFTALN